MCESIKEVLMRRDGISALEAQDIINQAKEALQEYIASGDLEAAENVCEEYFDLEPDFLTELM